MVKVINLPRRILLQLCIQLLGVEPAVWRQVLVPESITLPKLHEVIQAAMGWRDSHLHEFEINSFRYGQPDQEWDLGSDLLLSEADVRLGKCLANCKSFTYVYDLGDDWQHLIQVEERVCPDQLLLKPICLAGEGACPPEDVGGVPGYQHFISVMQDQANPEYEDFCAWLGAKAFDPGFFNMKQANLRLGRIRLQV